jgi:hypothetical protein
MQDNIDLVTILPLLSMQKLVGFSSEKWRQLASSHFGSDNGSDAIKNRNDSANRVKTQLQLAAHDIWMGRHEALHGIEKDKETKRLSALNSEITK